MIAGTLAEYLARNPDWVVKAYDADAEAKVLVTGITIDPVHCEFTICTDDTQDNGLEPTWDQMLGCIRDLIAFTGDGETDQVKQWARRDAAKLVRRAQAHVELRERLRREQTKREN